MKSLLLAPFLVLASFLPAAPAASPTGVPGAHLGADSASLPAAGTFTQTAITSLQAHTAGAVTILDQTSLGAVTGTISGTFEDDLRVVILPDGTFLASFTLFVTADVGGRQGGLTLRAWDVGELVGETTGHFRGFAVVTGATGGLSGMRGRLEIEGTVDLTTGLSTYAYVGELREPR